MATSIKTQTTTAIINHLRLLNCHARAIRVHVNANNASEQSPNTSIIWNSGGMMSPNSSGKKTRNTFLAPSTNATPAVNNRKVAIDGDR